MNEFTLFILILAGAVISDFNKVHIKNLLNDHVLVICCNVRIIKRKRDLCLGEAQKCLFLMNFCNFLWRNVSSLPPDG